MLALFEALSPIHGITIGIVRLLLFLTLFPYLGIALQHVYGGRQWMTALKTISILTIYSLLIVVTMGAIVYVTLRRL
jgi:hypothetical protein